MATALQASKNGMRHLVNGSNNHVLLSDEKQEEEVVLTENGNENAVSPTNGNEILQVTLAPPCIAQGGEDIPEVDIEISNVVCSFSVKCHLNLREIALNGNNVEYKREQGMVTMKLRRPYTTASIWSSGKITVTGATTEAYAYQAARRIARSLQRMGFKTKFSNYRVVNVLGSCLMPFNIKIAPFSERHRNVACYEPELHPGVTYRIKEPPKATLKIFSTGSITVTGAPSVAAVQAAVEHIYPLVQEFQSKRTADQIEKIQHRADLKRQRLTGERSVKRAKKVSDSESEADLLDIYEGGSSESSDDSDESYESCD